VEVLRVEGQVVRGSHSFRIERSFPALSSKRGRT
jgi:hypothetical protein